MQLTAEAFQQVIQTLRSDAQRQDGLKELRKQPRVGVRGRATILIPGKTGSKTYQVNVRDLSAAGVGLLHPEPLLTEGDQFLLVLPTENELARLSILYVAKRVVRLSPHLFMTGASLLKEVGVSEVRHAPPPPPASRAAPAAPPAGAVHASAAEPAAPAGRETTDETQERIRRAILG